MRVLWFCNGDLSDSCSKGYNGGGWMRSMLSHIKRENLTVGVVSLGTRNGQKDIDGIRFYSVCCPKNVRSKIFDKFRSLHAVGADTDARYVKEYQEIIADYRPDVIHVWGTENNYGLIASKVKTPCVIHLQGLLNPYKDFLLPPSYSERDYFFRNGLLYALFHRKDIVSWEYQSKRERQIFSGCKHFIGRTDWDRTVTSLLSPDSTYYLCNEMLREDFMESPKWQLRQYGKTKLTSVISPPLYKGASLVLRTAKLLKETADMDFEWNVYGVDSIRFTERHENIKADDVNVCLRGTATAGELARQLCESTVYVHPSYIDNSPNSVCEAQYLGVPVIATNVGGVSSLIDNGMNGILVQSHDAYMLAGKIKMLAEAPELQKGLSRNAILAASARHDSRQIISTLMDIYKKLVGI